MVYSNIYIDIKKMDFVCNAMEETLFNTKYCYYFIF